MSWPPELADLKRDLGIEDTRDDATLGDQLSAAIAFVERVRQGAFNFAGDADPLSSLPSPHEDLILGTVRLAGRWHTRRRSPDGLVNMGSELGSTRVPSFDPDIERLLGVGRYRDSVIA